MKQRFLACVLAMAAAPALAEEAAGGDGFLPRDIGYVSVLDHGAVPDDGKDDTAAIRAAIEEAIETSESRYATPRMVYLPIGTYLVSDTLQTRVGTGGWSKGWRSGSILRGQDERRTILKLADNHRDFQDANKPKPVLMTGSENPVDSVGGGNQAFRHGIMNLTVDVGSGNPGAVGIDFLVHNRGTVEQVTIRSSDPDHAGRFGLNMSRSWPGPGLIQDVTIEGFDHGVNMGSHTQYGMVFENLTVRNQREAGVYSKANPLHLRGLTSENDVPAVVLKENRLITITDAHLAGGGSDTAAIELGGKAFLSNVSIAGYGTAIDVTSREDNDLPLGSDEMTIAEWTSHEANTSFDSADASLNLDAPATPRFHSDDPADWANVEDFGATPSGGEDDSEGIQAAIDSGKAIVYLPNGSYTLSDTLLVRGSTKLILGGQASLGRGDDFPDDKPLVEYVGKSGEATTMEHVWLSGRVEHSGGGDFAIRHGDFRGGGGFVNRGNGAGDSFLDDVIFDKATKGTRLTIRDGGRVFGRQVNIEFAGGPYILNDGGTLWLHSYKTEGQDMVLRTINGGTTELLGGFIYPLRKPAAGTVMIEVVDSDFSGAFQTNGGTFPILVRETRGGVTRDFTSGDALSRGGSRLVPLYLGHD